MRLGNNPIYLNVRTLASQGQLLWETVLNESYLTLSSGNNLTFERDGVTTPDVRTTTNMEA